MFCLRPERIVCLAMSDFPVTTSPAHNGDHYNDGLFASSTSQHCIDSSRLSHASPKLCISTHAIPIPTSMHACEQQQLISNASDALDKVRFLAVTKPELLEDKEELEVRIEYDEDNKTLTIRDSGIGMTKEDLTKNLGTVARSGTTKFMEGLGDGTADISQIGQFGVGFYSAFLVADRVTVASKHPDNAVQHVWESTDGHDAFYIAEDPRGNTLGRGTEITLHLKEDAEEYASPNKLRTLAKHYSEFVTHPLHLRTTTKEMVDVEDDEEEEGAEEEKKEEEETSDEGDKSGDDEDDIEVSDEEAEEKPKKQKEVTTYSWEELNTEQAIWTRSKDEITDDEYQGFWKVVNKQANEDATAWSHFDAEGNINFKSLVYLPSEIPPQLLQGNMDEYRGGLKLYVRKVLISDEFELMPRYLSFIRGVSDDIMRGWNLKNEAQCRMAPFSWNVYVISNKPTSRLYLFISTFLHPWCK